MREFENKIGMFLKLTKAQFGSSTFGENAIPWLVFLLAICLHVHTLMNGIVFDDRAALLMNPDARGERSIFELFFKRDFWGQDITAHDSHKSYRPLTVLSLRMNHSIHGISPLGYHLVNVSKICNCL
jgi:hypothetical protein